MSGSVSDRPRPVSEPSRALLSASPDSAVESDVEREIEELGILSAIVEQATPNIEDVGSDTPADGEEGDDEIQVRLGDRNFVLVAERPGDGAPSRKWGMFRLFLRVVMVATIVVSTVFLIQDYIKDANQADPEEHEMTTNEGRNITVVDSNSVEDNEDSKTAKILILVAAAVALCFDFSSEAKEGRANSQALRRVSPEVPVRKVLFEVAPSTPVTPIIDLDADDEVENSSPSSQFSGRTPDSLISYSPASCGSRGEGRSPALQSPNSNFRRADVRSFAPQTPDSKSRRAGGRSPALLSPDKDVRRELFDISPPVVGLQDRGLNEDVALKRPHPVHDAIDVDLDPREAIVKSINLKPVKVKSGHQTPIWKPVR